MAQDTIKIKAKAKAKGSNTEIRCIITHPMETGFRKDPKTNAVIPAHFIQEVTAELNDKVIMTANWGVGVSKDPYFSFRIKDAKVGDQVRISWLDNKGDKDSAVTMVIAV